MVGKRILVTGGAGFLGSHLCDKLIADEHEVVCLDSFFTGTRANIAHLLGHPRFELVRHDVQQPLTLEVDQIYHLACPASPIHYQRNPVRTIRTAVEGTLNLLEVARESNARMLIASTSEVYGDPSEHPQRETYWGNVNPIGPRGVYDEAKRYAEALTMAYLRQQGVDTCIVRIFNTFGPRMRPNDGRAIPTFLRQALSEGSVTVFGDGSQTRSFCFVDDLVRGLVALAESGVHEPVNLGNPEEMTLLDMAKLVIEVTESRSEIVHAALPVDDPKVRQPDITRARELLGWQPEVDMGEGLRRTVDYAIGQLGLPA